jgi:hypothetical protein
MSRVDQEIQTQAECQRPLAKPNVTLAAICRGQERAGAEGYKLGSLSLLSMFEAVFGFAQGDVKNEDRPSGRRRLFCTATDDEPLRMNEIECMQCQSLTVGAVVF